MTKADVLNIIYEVVGNPRHLKTNKKNTIVKALNEVGNGKVRVNDSRTSSDELWSSEKTSSEISKAIGGSVPEYMIPISAEENNSLNNNATEWAFGNGANTPAGGGITIYVPTGYKCEVVAMTATTNTDGGNSNITLMLNGVNQGAACDVTLSGRTGVNDSFSPLDVVSGDRIGFRTVTAGINSKPNTVTVWLKYTKL